MLTPFPEWAARVANTLSFFELPEEGRALDRDLDALDAEITALREETTRETRVPNWRLRRNLRRTVNREHRRKKRALERYAAWLAERGVEEVEEVAREERRRVLLEA